MHQQHRHTGEEEELYRRAVLYGREGDVYNAVKLCKLLVRKSPDWSAPYALLSGIYKGRQEWKPALYYSQRAIENNPFDEIVWKNMALAATALGDWSTARSAWNQLGFRFKLSPKEPRVDLGPIPLRLNPRIQPEIVEAIRIDPARAIILSIPQPSSGRRYRDEVLIDDKTEYSFVSRGKKLNLFDEIQVLKPSLWRTYAVILLTSAQDDVETLARLCQEYELGFDNWSNATRFFRSNLHDKVLEYYDHQIFGKWQHDSFLIAIASRHARDVEEVLEKWNIISLKSHVGLECIY